MSANKTGDRRKTGEDGIRGWLRKEGKEWLKSGIYAFILFLIIRSFFIQAFKIPSASMEKTLLVGDFLLVNKLVYGPLIPLTDIRFPSIREPKRGDIVVFKYPRDKSLDFVKRCVAVSGDTVEMRDKELFVNGVRQDEDYIQHIDSRIESNFQRKTEAGSGRIRFPLPRDNFGPIIVPEDQFFVLGDNRDNSRDSRFWGFVDRELIKGTPLIIYFSWNKEKFAPRFGRIGDLIQ
jgi:signal peptidase I